MNTVYIAFGSNVGNRLVNIHRAMDMLPGDIIDSSFLYKTAPMYVTDQPYFYNGVVKLKTDMNPSELLSALHEIERELGREKIQHNGPRTIDLDVLFFNNEIHKLKDLDIPHPKLIERDFVLGPLMDIDPDLEHPKLDVTIRQLYSKLERNTLERVVPIHKKEINWTDRTLVMGILNVTPDSFSDGGLHEIKEKAIERANQMIKEGADILDIGGQSTRPGAILVSADEEIERIIPVIKEIRHHHPDIIISCDTFSSQVAVKAIKTGADIINDVTAGRMDPNMHIVMSEYNKPFIMTHSRGDSKTMTTLKDYENIVFDSRKELDQLIAQALAARVYRWNIIVDPGFGFAKDIHQNLELIKSLKKWKRDYPCCIGTSRKGFIGKILDVDDPKDRLIGSLTTVAHCVSQGANIVRVHDVKETVQVVKMTNRIYPLTEQSILF